MGRRLARRAFISEIVSLARSGLQIGLHPGQVVVHGVAPGAGALGQEDSLFQVRVEGELERDSAREQLSAVRAWCCR